MLKSLNPLTEPEIWTEAPTEDETQLDPPYRILLHNKEKTYAI